VSCEVVSKVIAVFKKKNGKAGKTGNRKKTGMREKREKKRENGKF
jgi:hypothetical protein